MQKLVVHLFKDNSQKAKWLSKHRSDPTKRVSSNNYVEDNSTLMKGAVGTGLEYPLPVNPHKVVLHYQPCIDVMNLIKDSLSLRQGILAYA